MDKKNCIKEKGAQAISRMLALPNHLTSLDFSVSILKLIKQMNEMKKLLLLHV